MSYPPNTANPLVDLVGSTSWIGADAYGPGDELHNRAMAVLAKLNWDHLLSISSALNNGVPCTFSQKLSIGHFNMFRRILKPESSTGSVSPIIAIMEPVLSLANIKRSCTLSCGARFKK